MSMVKKSLLALLILTALVFIGINSGLISLEALNNKPHLSKTTFTELPAWTQDDHRAALQTFQNSCLAINNLRPDAAFSPAFAVAGKVSNWQTICRAAAQLKNPDEATARQFFEHWFQPFMVKNYFSSQGLFTGYYLPLLAGSLKPSTTYSVPIYALPKDIVKIDLGAFNPEWRGKVITGQLSNGNFVPYPGRAAINNGAIANSAKVLLWSKNAVDVFFLQIQGSGIVQLPNGKQVIVAYAGNNGQPYTSIGKLLIKRKALTRDTVSMQSIKAWLAQHPDQATQLLNSNASYVFFKILNNPAPLGTEQVPLTPERSLAVDSNFIPLGAPLWLDTTIMRDPLVQKTVPFQRLLIAQDTGSGTKGVIRGDVYWGNDAEAEFVTGHMKNPGRYWILLPRSQLLNQPIG